MIRNLLAAALLAAAPLAVQAASLVVIDARAAGLKPGMSIDSAKPISLKEGERVTVIGPDGKSSTIRGVFSGPPMPGASTARDPKKALLALVATRDSRASAVGAVRAGTEVTPLPDPWLVDISRAGPRCLREGQTPTWWRPEPNVAAPFTVFPMDRSWRADFAWADGEDRMLAPQLSRLDGATVFIVRYDNQDNALAINLIPQGIDDEFILASWMLEKGCIQQADALLRQITAADAATATPVAEVAVP